MRLASYKGPLLLLAWQIVPISVGPDSAGRFQVAVGWGGGQFERLSGFGGILTQNGVGSGWGGAQAALEARYVGLGLGVASMPFDEFDGAVPSAYVRFGSRDHVHFRMDAFHPTTAVGATGDVFRIGVGFNQGQRRGKRGFFGFNVGPYSDESHVGGFFGEFEAPIASRVDLSFGGSWRPSTEEFDGGIRAGLRYHFGVRR